MKLPGNRKHGVLALSVLLASGAGLASPVVAREHKVAASDVMGPAGDYPVTLGDPFVIDGATYTPADTLNYDAVGKAVQLAPEEGSAARIDGAHRTLPVPSYVEVTSLANGHTILVRIDRRGPMSGDGLVALSPLAWEQLGLPGEASAPVRVRRVNPPEPERALLRSGQTAPRRMDTPPGLLAALRRKLGLEPPVGDLPATIHPAELVASKPAAAPDTSREVAAGRSQPEPARKPVSEPVSRPAPRTTPQKAGAPAAKSPQPVAPTNRPVVPAAQVYVQIGAFAQRANAESAARKAGGALVKSGSLWRVRSGPFSAGDEAASGLAKARAAGYATARIVRD